MKKVPKVNRPLKEGEECLVPCVDGLPVLWPPHTDVHDGQQERHFHVDTRFCDIAHPARPRGAVKWVPMKVKRTDCNTGSATDVSLITNAIRSKPCKAMINGKCPHKGFNLAQVRPNGDGFIVCPMHGMRFHPQSGKGVPYRMAKDDYSEEELWRMG